MSLDVIVFVLELYWNCSFKGEQAGAELCQAQNQVGLPAEVELILRLSSIETIFHLFKIALDSTSVDLHMFQSEF